jgi:uncharacterized protein (DUF1697 family)
MRELRELFELLGFKDVRTLIQSGNVIFRAAQKPSPSKLQAAIAERFQVTSPVLLRTSSELAEIIRNDPFGDADRGFLHVGFMVAPVSAAELAALDVERFAPERIAAFGRNGEQQACELRQPKAWRLDDDTKLEHRDNARRALRRVAFPLRLAVSGR